MFGFGKKKDQEKKRSAIDKIIMGAIVGGAVGSVIGMTLAPKTGKATREYLAQKGKEIFAKGKELNEKIHQGVKKDFSEKKLGVFIRIKNKLFRKKSYALKHENGDLKKIPLEQLEENNIKK